MAEVFEFHDTEDLVRVYLEARLPSLGFDVPVHISVPRQRPESFVTVQRLGGTRQNLVVDAATLSVDSWAKRSKAAEELSSAVRGLMHALSGTADLGIAVYRVEEFAGPSNSPDSVSNHARYTQTFSVGVRINAL
jgi:hypothetical protein